MIEHTLQWAILTALSLLMLGFLVRQPTLRLPADSMRNLRSMRGEWR